MVKDLLIPNNARMTIIQSKVNKHLQARKSARFLQDVLPKSVTKAIGNTGRSMVLRVMMAVPGLSWILFMIRARTKIIPIPQKSNKRSW